MGVPPHPVMFEECMPLGNVGGVRHVQSRFAFYEQGLVRLRPVQTWWQIGPIQMVLSSKWALTLGKLFNGSG